MAELKESLPEDFRDGYVVVPDFKSTTPGITNVIRGDMTDDEWKTWLRVSRMRDIKRLFAKEGGKSSLSLSIYKYLTDKGITACRIGMARPII
jgi:hypothetical protein